MPAPRTITPALQKVRELAIQAQDSPEGLTFEFLSENYGGFDGAHRAARGFQTTFSSMRAKERRKAEAMYGTVPRLDTNVRVAFDDLSAFKNPLPHERGWTVSLLKSTSVFLDIVIRDFKTGEIVEQVDESVRQRTALYNLFMAKHKEYLNAPLEQTFRNPFDQDQEYWLNAHWPDFLVNILEEFGLKRNYAEMAQPAPVIQEADLADLSADDLFGDDQ